MTTERISENLSYRSRVSQDFLLLCSVNFLMILAQRMTNSILSVYADSLGASGTLTGLLSSAFTITSIMLAPFAGQIVNHFSKKRISAISICVIAAATFGFSISENFEVLLIFRLIQGMGLAFTGISCLTLLSLSVEEEKLAKAIAYYTICTSIAQAIGPQLGLMLGDAIGFRESFRIEAIILLISSFLISFVKNDEYKEERFRYSFRTLFAKEALLPAILIMLVMSANFTITSFITLFSRQMSIENIGIYFMANALVLTLVRPFADQISEKIGTVRLLPISLLSLGISLILIALSQNIGTFLLASAVNAFGYGTSLPIIEALCLKSVTKNRRALASATNSIGSNLGILLGPIMAGVIRDVSDYRMMFMTMTIPVAAAIVIVHVFRNRLEEINKEETNGL